MEGVVWWGGWEGGGLCGRVDGGGGLCGRVDGGRGLYGRVDGGEGVCVVGWMGGGFAW